VGQAPIAATVYELERLRCNLCGEIFEADAPASVGEKKYDETAAMIGLLRYGSGVPWYRLERLEASLGIPLPASTQCEIVAEVTEAIRPAFEELIRQAAQGEVFYNDDTSMKILVLARASPQRAEGKEETSSSHERTGLFTSGIVSTTQQGQRIALFFTGRNHAGENLARVFVERALKKCILHRKNSLFYKTENGAEMGDLFMSLIHTCELNRANPFDYLTELQKHARELAKNSAAWMPRPRELFKTGDPVTADFTYIRWLGDRKGIEEIAKVWNKLLIDRTTEMEEWISEIQK
jgi:hypothetical protein